MLCRPICPCLYLSASLSNALSTLSLREPASTYDTVVSAVRSGVDAGYRHFDTAYIYDTEKALGAALNQKIEEGVVTREELFVTTKLWCTSHRTDMVVPALRKGLMNMGLDYVDLFLVHWPMAMVPSEEIFPRDEKGEIIYEDDKTSIADTWKGMEECIKLGLAKSIGVSNYNIKQLQRLLDSCKIKPSVCQIEIHPFLSNWEMVNFCKAHDILAACFSPLGKPGRPWAQKDDPSIFTDRTLGKIARMHQKTPAQVALRYQLQRGLAVVPKSNSPQRQQENIDVFDFSLSEEEMSEISGLDRNFRVVALKQ